MRVCHPVRGLLMEAPLADPAGHPYLVLPHPEIERALTEEARATGRVTVRYRTQLTGLIEDPTGAWSASSWPNARARQRARPRGW